MRRDQSQSPVDSSRPTPPQQSLASLPPRLPPPHRLLPDPQFHQGAGSFLPPMAAMPMHRQLPPFHSLYPPSGPQYYGMHHPAPSHDLLPPAPMIAQPAPTSNPDASPRRTRSASVVSGMSLSASPASSTVSSIDSVIPLSMVSSASSIDLGSTAKRRPTRNRTSSTGSTGSVASTASLSSSSAPDYDSLGRKKPRIPRNPSSWDPHDDLLLRHLKEQQKLGWKDIANHFMGRTPNACQFRWRRLMSGSLRGGPIPARENQNWEKGPWEQPMPLPMQQQQQQQQMVTHMQVLPMIPATTMRPLVSPAEYESVEVKEQPKEERDRSTSAESSTTVTPTSTTSQTTSSASSTKSKSGKIWSQEEDDLVTRRDLRFEELSVLLPSRTETEIWARIESLQTTAKI